MLLAAAPATPVQLAHACYQFGFEVVIPASWGDELVAHAVIEDLRRRDRDPVIQCTCPFVADRLLANGQYLLGSMVQTASPPVAAARYARHAFAPRPIHVTYIGGCPGARHAAIDQQVLPDEFTRLLDQRDILLSDMPTVFDSVIPPDRRRYVSLPGGCPTQEALWQSSEGRMLREVTQPTFTTDLAQTLVWREYVLVDVAPSVGCACAGGYSKLGSRCGRIAVMALEPPRATQPVVAYQHEFVAPILDDIVVPRGRNGSEAEEPIAKERREAVQPAPDTAHQGPREEQPAVGKVRARTTASTLPRAYLAKRRHVASMAKETAAAAVPERAKTTAAEAPNAALHPAGPLPGVAHAAAETAAREPGPQAAPKESTPAALEEPPEVSLPIAVHVEPDAAPAAEATTTAPVEPTEQPESAEIPSPAPLAAPAPLAPPTPPQASTRPQPETALPRPPSFSNRVEAPERRRAPSPARSVRQAPADAVPTVVPPLEAPTTAVTQGLPLRVEVEIIDESGAAEPAEVALREPAPPLVIAPSAAAKHAPLRDTRVWVDVLIALWLVLVASAVITALLWRR